MAGALFDHLVGAGQQRRRHGARKSIRGAALQSLNTAGSQVDAFFCIENTRHASDFR